MAVGKTESQTFEQEVASALKRFGLTFERQPLIGGLRPDFLVRHDDGTTTIIEAKAWVPSTDTASRAAEQAKRYLALSGASRAVVVLPRLPRSQRRPGVASLSDLGAVLTSRPATLMQGKPGKQRKRARKSRARHRVQIIFAAMPFAPEYDDVFFVAMVPAAAKIGATCIRVDKEHFVGDIPERIRSDIRRSAAVIADVSEAKPNVLYEAGFSHALKIPTIHISSTPLNELPFDISHDNTMAYSKGQTHRVKGRLEKRLTALLRR